MICIVSMINLKEFDGMSMYGHEVGERIQRKEDRKMEAEWWDSEKEAEELLGGSSNKRCKEFVN